MTCPDEIDITAVGYRRLSRAKQTARYTLFKSSNCSDLRKSTTGNTPTVHQILAPAYIKIYFIDFQQLIVSMRNMRNKLNSRSSNGIFTKFCIFNEISGTILCLASVRYGNWLCETVAGSNHLDGAIKTAPEGFLVRIAPFLMRKKRGIGDSGSEQVCTQWPHKLFNTNPDTNTPWIQTTKYLLFK